jgi:hypothetical protein
VPDRRAGVLTADRLRAGLIGLGLVVAAGLGAPGLVADAGLAGPRVALYAAAPLPPGGLGDPVYRPLDPAVLDDLPGAAPLALPRPFWVSGDGSTAVHVDHERKLDPAGRRITVLVLDLPGGAERARFEPPLLSAFMHLSHDGGRLVMGLPQSRIDPPRSLWYVLDTADGRVLSEVEADGTAHVPRWFDPSARRLYRLVQPSARGQVLRIDAHDLGTGARVGQAEVGGEHAGDALTGPGPDVLLSPDGRRFAVLRGDAEVVALVDAGRMAVDRVIRPTRLDATWERLPFAVGRAEAKEGAAGSHRAVFGPDGRSLYAWGEELVPVPGGAPADARYCTSCHGPRAPSGASRHATAPATRRGLGLRRIDLEGGRVAAEALVGQPTDQVLPAPDARSLYVFGPKPVEAPTAAAPGAGSFLLRRLDAATLSVLAEREVDGPRALLVLPAP